jgi:hypothetical protein
LKAGKQIANEDGAAVTTDEHLAWFNTCAEIDTFDARSIQLIHRAGGN